MKIAAIQTRPLVGDVRANIEQHLSWLDLAASRGAAVAVFPELSLTGYEPKLANDLATTQDDSRFDVFQKLSDARRLTLSVGMPLRSETGIHVGLILFQPGQARQTYGKRHLHEDERAYFVPGDHDVLLTLGDLRLAPAICYESLLPEHAANAAARGANVYLASVAKSARGVEKAARHFPVIASTHSMFVVMANCVGPCDDFVGAGGSSTWSTDGELLGRLDDTGEGIMMLDVERIAAASTSRS